MQKLCNIVQEEVVWGRQLTEEQQRHVLACPNCSQVALDFSEFDSLIHRHLIEVEIPEGFVERVMNQIATSEVQQSIDWPSRLSKLFYTVMEFRPVQIGFASLGSLFALDNLIRFVLGVILPSVA